MEGRKMMATITCFLLLFHCAFSSTRPTPLKNQDPPSPPVKLRVSENYVEIDNGITKLSLLNPAGMISAIEYQGIENLLEYQNKPTQRGYWDIVWMRPDKGTGGFDPFQSTSFQIIAETENQVELSFVNTWNVSQGDEAFPLNIDKRFVVLQGVSGFYSYAIFEHLKGWPDLNIDEARIAFKLQQDLFHYMAISDNKQRIMPSNSDRETGQKLQYKESVLITNPKNPELKGEVDDKYQYSLENKDNRVHGWISTSKSVGLWMIMPSDEFRSGGPVKPDLTSHVGPTCLSAFLSSHYAGRDFGVRLRNGEPWKKVLGPIFVYLNSNPTNATGTLWEDAKRQMLMETSKWPYDFPRSIDFPKTSQRGTIHGRLLVNDKYVSTKLIPAKSAYIGLAPPGNPGSWQNEAKGYQFWTRTNETGYFMIKDIRPDTYNLYAWVPGFLGDYKREGDITITPGDQVQMGHLVYNPPRNGPTLWEIGIPDRSAAEFYIPDPAPGLVNKLFHGKDKYRQYGLWDRYTDIYPTQDLSYTVGVSDYRKDWFFAHVNRKISNSIYTPTTWRVSFELRNITRTETYTLRLALASANQANLQVRINTPNAARPQFLTRQIGKDNAIARHGIHGLSWMYSIDIRGCQFLEGENTIYIKQVKTTAGPFNGVMYDYIRLEGPPQTFC